MSTLFDIVDDEGNRIEVRSAGASRRLYINGVLNTQYNPRHLVTGDVWDPLALAGLLAPQGTLDDVLLLGLGGGTAVHMLQHIVKPRGRITAVDSSATIAQLAAEHFGAECHVLVDDARRAVDAHVGREHVFSLIIDDIFSRDGAQAQRGYPFDASWRDRLLSLWGSTGGVLVANLAGPREVTAALQELPEDVRCAYVFAVERCENRILALSSHDTDRQTLLARVKSALPAAQHRRLRWRVTRKRLPR